MNTVHTPLNFVVVAISWDDAVYHHGPLDAQELDAAVKPVPVTTVGYLVRESEEGYLVAAEVHAYPYEPQWGGVSFVPKKMVHDVRRLT